jgi:hypothetical protein
MLNRLIILNSEIYSKADIELANCDSLQIVGPNNIGKSTLIYALNFLFIIDGREMTFSGKQKGDKATIDWYFPTINTSFIIFEVFKKRYYSILIKKNAEGTLDYYKIDSEYKEEFYFKEIDKGQKLRKFNDLLSEFKSKGIEFTKFTNRRDIFNFVYQKGKGNNGVVWLDKNVSQDGRGISNNFSKIYKYLINSKLIDNDSLKESLIIADNRENEKVSFSKKNQNDIRILLRHNRDIKIIRSIQKSFLDFKELINQYSGKSTILSELIFAFNQQYSFTYSELGTNLSKMKTERDEKRQNLNENLNPKKDELNRTIGKLQTQTEQKQKELNESEKLIKEIQSFEDLAFLKEAFHNLEKERKDIESQITLIENHNLSSKQIENEIEDAEKKISKIGNRINSYSNQLIHQISSKQEHKELLNRILTDDITSLSKESISKGINNLDSLMKLFDGAIKLPTGLKGKPIDSIEELKKQVEKLKKGKAINDKLLPIAKDLEKHRENLIKIKTKINELNRKISKIEILPELREKHTILKSGFESLSEEKEKSTRQIELLSLEIDELTESIESLGKTISGQEQRKEKIQSWKVELEQEGIKPIKYQTNDSIDNIYRNIQRNLKERSEVKIEKNKLFERLKNKTDRFEADEKQFIHYVDSELATLDDKEKAIDGLLKSISTQFANPCKTLLSNFDQFDSFIKNKYNSKIRNIKISDIESLKIEILENKKLIKDLKLIMQIRDIAPTELEFDDQNEKLTILNKYLDAQKTITFENLFDIRLHLTVKGQNKIVDPKDQIESEGTDKMIKLVLVMSILNQMIVNDDENKIILFVDEVKNIDIPNRYALTEFCKENNFVPIYASNEPADGFDKYYFVWRGKKKIVVSEKSGNVIRRKPIKA